MSGVVLSFQIKPISLFHALLLLNSSPSHLLSLAWVSSLEYTICLVSHTELMLVREYRPLQSA